MSYKEYKIAIVGFYQIIGSFNGASEVSLSLYKSINCRKKLFDLKNPKSLEKNLILNFLYPYLIKPLRILFQIRRVLNFFHKSKKNLLIIEGASWIGYSYIFIKIIKLFNRDIKIMYHAHNIEYDIRKLKNSKFIQVLTFWLEKKVLNLSDYPTSVSKLDQKKNFLLYKKKTITFYNGISLKRLDSSKKKIKNKYIIFSGNYFFLPNKIAVDKLVKFFTKLNIDFKNIKLLITGSEIPLSIEQKKFVIFKKNLSKKNLNNYLINSICTILPLKDAPGTKLKVIEALLNGVIVVGTKHAFKGIDLFKMKPPFIYKNNYQLYKIINNIIKNEKKIKDLSIKDISNYKKKYLMENISKKFFDKNLI